MRCTLSLILVVAFTSLANAQQVFPKRLPKLDDLSGSQQQFTPRAPAAHGYFGPLDAVGTEQIPKAIPRSQSDDLSPIAEVDDSSMVDAVQFSEPQVVGTESFLPAPIAPSAPSGYRETPTRPVRTTRYPTGLKDYDETAFTRQRATAARESFQAGQCNCGDDWDGFCSPANLDWECRCKTFPGPNFLPHHRCQCGSRKNSNCNTDSCGNELPNRWERRRAARNEGFDQVQRRPVGFQQPPNQTYRATLLVERLPFDLPADLPVLR